MVAVRILLTLTLLLLGRAPVEQPPQTGAPTVAPSVGTYQGTFAWDGDGILQRVRFRLEKVVERNGDVVELEGTGVYLDTDTHIRLRCVLSTSTREFDLYESDPRGGSSSFVTDGRHHGTFAPDYGSARGRWVDSAGHELGTLKLDRV